MPPKASSSTSTNTGPVPPPTTTPIISEPDSINRYPEAQEYPGDTLPSTQAQNDDIPGPSTTYIPRQPSPPLPDLSKKASGRNDNDDDSDDESDDEIAYTLPIYLSSTLSPTLNLFQYPLHHRSLKAPTWAEDRGKKITTRIKENVGRVEIEVPVDAGVNVWREDRAKDLGFVNDVKELNGNGNGDVEVVGGIQGKGKEKKTKVKKKEEKWGEKVRLRSEVLPNVTGYYSGIVHDGALHLHPINRTLQFRTSLTYLDEYDLKLRAQQSITRTNPNGDDADDPSAPPAQRAPPPPTRHNTNTNNNGKPLRQEVENDGSGSIKDFRNKMWSLAQAEEDDKWVGYEWREGEDERVITSLGGLLADDEKREWLKCQTRPLDYLNKE